MGQRTKKFFSKFYCPCQILRTVSSLPPPPYPENVNKSEEKNAIFEIQNVKVLMLSAFLKKTQIQ